MSSTTPIFETSVSPLYYSNDGRLRIETQRANGSNIHVVSLDGVEVMRTQYHMLADAYIAGYDLRDARDEYSEEEGR